MHREITLVQAHGEVLKLCLELTIANYGSLRNPNQIATKFAEMGSLIVSETLQIVTILLGCLERNLALAKQTYVEPPFEGRSPSDQIGREEHRNTVKHTQ